jgi:hypothetical protein
MLSDALIIVLLIFLFACSGIFTHNKIAEAFTVPVSYNSPFSYNTITFPACSVTTYAGYNVARKELEVLVEKIEAMTSDIQTGAGRITRSVAVPYNAETDIEPAAAIVGRCRRQLVRERDIHLITKQFQRRAEIIIRIMSKDSPSNAQTTMTNVTEKINLLANTMLAKCTTKQPQLDMPDGVRDPAYYESPELETLRKTASF